ncbi:MAG: hypothetical protein ABH862_06915 [Candidatus Omnitrophota bacterium]
MWNAKLAGKGAGILKGLFFLCLISFVFVFYGNTEDVVLYDFETDQGGWDFPDWAFSEADYVCKSITLSDKLFSSGKKSLALEVDFTGNGFCSAIVETQAKMDLEKYNSLSCDIIMRGKAKKGVKARFIIFTGEEMTWTEMNETVSIGKDKWKTLTADITEGSLWKRLKYFERTGADGKKIMGGYRYIKVPLTKDMKKDIRALAIRIESESIRYKGTVYLDNIHVAE